ncbi:MAG: discoidin domain-containing protein [Bauldia sp.]
MIGVRALALLAGSVLTANWSAAADVRPLSDILVASPRISDITSDGVVILATTRIPVVCAAAIGTSTAYGRLATDTDMAGGGHQDHHPQIGGLQPNTLYHLRLTGIGPDGTVYVGDDLTFRTAAASQAASKPPGRNVALLSAGATIRSVSSNFGGGDNRSAYGADKAIDGDPNSEWSSNGDGNGARIEVDLGRDYSITAVGFRTRTMGTSAQISKFTVTTDRGQTLGPFDLPDARATYYFPTSITARTLRFDVVASSGGNTGATEIEVYSQQ